MQSLGKVEPLGLHHEVEDRAADTASETVEEAALGVNGKGRSFLFVEWAKHDVVAACSAQADMCADDFENVGASPDLFNPTTGSHFSQSAPPSAAQGSWS